MGLREFVNGLLILKVKVLATVGKNYCLPDKFLLSLRLEFDMLSSVNLFETIYFHY